MHYELDPSPVRYAYPSFWGTRDAALVRIVRDRLNTFDLLLGGAPKVMDVDSEGGVRDNANLLEQLKRSLGDKIGGSLAVIKTVTA